MLELKPTEQLEPEDIQKALEDASVRPVSLYGSVGSLQPGTQLYFGPGFENRLEVEMEE